VTVAGAAAETPGLVVPDAPPPPASFEGVPAQPAPTPPPPLPVIFPPASAGQVLFATGSATLDPSQNETLRHAIATRGKGHIAIDGHGETQSDAPAGQEAALTLGLQRALTIATRLEKFGVPADALRLSATAFGRGATVTTVP
jgi:outer membrane protein OmpA-like peptidoglycan-associated protein